MFRAEGVKLVKDILSSGIKPHYIFTTDSSLLWEGVSPETLVSMDIDTAKKCSLLSTPSSVIAIFEKPIATTKEISGEWALALDGISDAGNLGTIIRLADWFGLDRIYASTKTVDLYNPKVVQSTMGSIARVEVEYTDLEELCHAAQKNGYHTTGTFMKGDSVYDLVPAKRLLIMGSEAHGISPQIENLATERITIPRFSESGPESLNVAVATSILVSQLVKK